jgi:MFS family permease
MRRQDAAAAAVFVALAVGMTWPLARNLERAVSDPGDPYITIWVLDWDWWATLHAPLSLFHANAFFPAKYSLAFSENLYGLALLTFPLRMFGASPITAHGIAVIAGFAFSGFGAYVLGRRLTGSWIAGMAAGVFYAFVPFRFTHLPHVQHIWGGWLPLMLAALLAYAERPTRRRAILFAAAFAMNGLTNIHYLFFGALATAITAALLLPRSKWREIAMATGGALVILAPFLYPYAAAAKLYGMQRSWAEVLHFSAFASDWLPGLVAEPERRIYPGALAYVVALLALFIARKQKPQLALALLWIVIGFLGSLGLHFVLHEFLFGAVPGFRAVRVPARWAVIAYVGLAMLIALATAALARRNRWLAALVPLAFLASLWPAPIRWYLADPQMPAVHRWLATQPVRAIAELPIDTGASEYEALLHATAHHRPMINGISGFAPPGRDELAALANATPVADTFVDKLRTTGVELLIIHADSLGDRKLIVRDWLRRELERGSITFVRRFHSPTEGDWVFRVGGPREPPSPQLADFLAGKPTCGDGTMGALDFPPPAIRFDRGQAIFSGWTMSPHGIRGVDLWFDNRTVRLPAKLVRDPLLDQRCPGDARLTRTRYLAVFEQRPPNIRRRTDVQVEVTDGRGAKTVFDDRWLTWD